MNEQITVVIACFDYGAFLRESVESALGQRGGEPTGDRGRRRFDRRAHARRAAAAAPAGDAPAAGERGGRRRAQRGVASVQTPYALVLDADDRLAEDALARLLAPLQADRSLGFAYGLMRFFGAWEGVVKLPPYDPYRLLYRHNIGATALVRRELLEDVGGFDPAFAGYEDWEFWLRALERGWRGRRVEEVTLLYRRHGCGASRRRAAALPRELSPDPPQPPRALRPRRAAPAGAGVESRRAGPAALSLLVGLQTAAGTRGAGVAGGAVASRRRRRGQFRRLGLGRGLGGGYRSLGWRQRRRGRWRRGLGRGRRRGHGSRRRGLGLPAQAFLTSEPLLKQRLALGQQLALMAEPRDGRGEVQKQQQDEADRNEEQRVWGVDDADRMADSSPARRSRSRAPAAPRPRAPTAARSAPAAVGGAPSPARSRAAPTSRGSRQAGCAPACRIRSPAPCPRRPRRRRPWGACAPARRTGRAEP